MVPVDSIQVSRDWTYSGAPRGVCSLSCTGLSPSVATLSRRLPLTTHNPILESYNPTRETLVVWAIPISLAATDGIDFSFSSSGYLDVSVHQVITPGPMNSVQGNSGTSDHRLFVNSPKIFADFHALHRLSMPRHPPCALGRLAVKIPNSTTKSRSKKSLHSPV